MANLNSFQLCSQRVSNRKMDTTTAERSAPENFEPQNSNMQNQHESYRERGKHTVELNSAISYQLLTFGARNSGASRVLVLVVV